MMSKSFCSIVRGRAHGFETIQLDNGLVRADVLPELGGKLWNLWHRTRDIQWLWHNPHCVLRAVRLGASYDDNWAGGWEELFPNDAEGEFLGKNLPDHGEWWSQPWKWAVSEDSPERVSIRLSLDGTVTRTHCEKQITLEAGAAQLSVRYRITNHASEPLRFLFKQHLAVSVTQAHRLELPGGKVTPVDLDFSTRIGAAGPFDWPSAKGRTGEPVDLSVLPPEEEKHREFVYVAQLPEGWCGVRDTRTGAVLRFHFPLDIFPYTWMFMTFGGWHSLYTVVLEPCTNMPKDLKTALHLGQCGILAPQATMSCEVRAELS
jgi:hypothetical protein